MSELKQFEIRMRVTVDRIVTVEALDVESARDNWMRQIIDEQDIDVVDWDIKSVKEIR